MAMLEPKLAILDETDSGLDIDALRIVSNGVNKLKAIKRHHSYYALSKIWIIVPDFVHVRWKNQEPEEKRIRLDQIRTRSIN
jgi:Fe-S cluster assembly ATP-binding protein